MGRQDDETEGDETTDADDATAREPVASEAKSRRSLPRLTGDRYEIGERIGKGGMGEVMTARDLQIGRDVAIKRLHGEREVSDLAMLRFLREAQIQGRLDHPSIVPVYEMGRNADGRPFFVMKQLAGTTLSAILGDAKTKVTRQRLLRAFADVCLAIELAHTRGIIHRDIKPANIMLGDFGEVYVLDWGVAKVLHWAEVEIADIDTGDLVTRGGSVVGTPGYMSPEQARSAADLDGRADIYALGCVLFEILAGERLHPPGNAGINSATSGLVDARPSRRAADRAIPPELDELCVRATATERRDRIATARELGEGVQRYLDGDRDLERRRDRAKELLETAQTSFAAREDEAQRRVAMRAAGQALALDPDLQPAADLVGRLMIEPPAATPAEVGSALTSEFVEMNRRHARISAIVYMAGFAGFAPYIFSIRGIDVLSILFVVVLIVSLLELRMRARTWTSSVVSLAVRNAIMIGVIGLVFSPLLFAPAVAVLVTAASMHLTTSTRRRDVIVVTILLSASVALPFAAELLGIVPHRTILHPNGIEMISGPLNMPEWTRYVGLFSFQVVAVLATALISFRVRTAELESRHRLHLQSWHLKQLVSA